MIYRQINEIFEHNNIKLKTVYAKDTCIGCCFLKYDGFSCKKKENIPFIGTCSYDPGINTPHQFAIYDI